MSEVPRIKTYRFGAAGLIQSMCNEIGLVEHVNNSVRWDEKQWKVSPGEHILALVINTLCGRVPLYRVEEFFEDHDVEGLFGKGRIPHDFNHYALGRALDAFHKAGAKSIFTSLTLRNLLMADTPLQFIHGDTTTKVMYGVYEGDDNKDTLNIERGHSKDKRYDLKQIVMGLVTIGRGMPLLGNVNDGNLDDKTWNKQLVDTMVKELKPEQIQKLVYVADSAFFNQINAKKAHSKSLSFISLVSENHSLRSDCIEQVLNNYQMETIGRLSEQKNASEYSIQEVSKDYHNIPLRCLVVYSSRLAEKKEASFEKKLTKEQEKLQKAAKKLAKEEFSCIEAADKAGELFCKKNSKSLFPISYSVEPLTRPIPRKKRGRMSEEEKKNREMETVYNLRIDIAPVPPDVIEEKKRRLGYFVLATNHTDVVELPTKQILQEYKQQSSVELRFKFLKDPMFVDSLFLEKPERIEALGYVLLIALFIYMTLEERIRNAVQENNIRLQPVRGWYTSKPTAKQVILMLNHIVSIYWYDEGTCTWQRQMQQKEHVKQIYDLLCLKPYENTEKIGSKLIT